MDYGDLKKAVSSNDFTTFNKWDFKCINGSKVLYLEYAAEKGDLDVVKYLIDRTPDKEEQFNMICKSNAFNYAATKGHLDIVKYFIELFPDKEKQYRMAGDPDLLPEIAARGHLNVVKYYVHLNNILKDPALGGDQSLDMMRNNFKNAFVEAAEWGRLNIVEYFISITEFTALHKQLNKIFTWTEEIRSSLKPLKELLQSLKKNDLKQLDKLFGITRVEGKIVDINEVNHLTLAVVKKAIDHFKDSNSNKESVALLVEIVEQARKQHEQVSSLLNHHFPQELSNIVTEYLGYTSIQQKAPAFSESAMALDTPRNNQQQDAPTSSASNMALDTPRNR